MSLSNLIVIRQIESISDRLKYLIKDVEFLSQNEAIPAHYSADLIKLRNELIARSRTLNVVDTVVNAVEN